MAFVTHIKNSFCPVHNIAQLLGLAPYSFQSNPVTSEESINISWKWNSKKCIWTVTLFIVDILGFIYTLAVNSARPPTSVSDLLLNVILVSLIQSTGPLAVFFAVVVNPGRMREIVRRLSKTDKFLRPNSKDIKRHMTSLAAALTCSLVLSLPLYVAESLMSDDTVSECATALSHVTWQISDLQYLNLVTILRHRLRTMSDRLRSACVVDYFRNEDSKIWTTSIVRDGNRVSGITLNHVTRDQIWETSTARKRSCNCNKCRLASMILTFREHYNALYEACCLVNSINGCTMLLNWLVFVVSVSINLYHMTVVFMSPSASGQLGQLGQSGHMPHSTAKSVTFILWTVLTVARMCAIALWCQWATDEHQGCMDTVQEVLLRHGTGENEEEVLTQLESFSAQLVNNKIEFTVGGMYPVNSTVLCAAAGLVIQYVILLFQMRERDVAVRTVTVMPDIAVS